MSEEEEYEKINNEFLIACGMGHTIKNKMPVTEFELEFEKVNDEFKNATGTASKMIKKGF